MKNFTIEYTLVSYGKDWPAKAYIQAENEAMAMAHFVDQFSKNHPKPPAYVKNGRQDSFENISVREMTLADYWDKLNRHDWYYAMSDDHGVWLAGERAVKELNALADVGGEEWQALRVAFAQHYFSGPPWETEQSAKPERPA